jgi:hypothetical protein
LDQATQRPPHARDRFIASIEDGCPDRKLAAFLTESSDILPQHVRSMLQLSKGSTVGDAAKMVRRRPVRCPKRPYPR